MRHHARQLPRQPTLYILQDKNQQRGRRPGAPSFGHYLEISRELPQPIRCEAAEIARVFVKGMAERHHQVGEAARGKRALDLAHHGNGIFHVFEHGIALHPLEQTAGK
jgi:hypothetical protein